VGVPLLVAALLSLWADLVLQRQATYERMTPYLSEIGARNAAELDGRLRTVAGIAGTLAGVLGAHAGTTPDDVHAMLERSLRQTADAAALRAAFEPGVMGGAGAPVVLGVVRREGVDPRAGADAGRASTREPPSLLSGAEGERPEWYTRAVGSGREAWLSWTVERDGSLVDLATFSAPIERGGRVVGVVCAELRVDRIESIIAQDSFWGRDGAFIVTARNGDVIAARSNRIHRGQNVVAMAEALRREDLRGLVVRFQTGETGALMAPALEGSIPMAYFFAPVHSTGWSFVGAMPQEVLVGHLLAEAGKRSLGVLMLTLGMLALVMLVAWRLTSPIRDLAQRVTQLGEGRLDVPPLTVRGTDELADLGRSFNAMTGRLKEHVEALRVETRAREAVESELRVAREIQVSLLPTEFPGSDRFEIFALNAPARHVAGDFFDVFSAPGGELTLVVADVSGKGVPAAMFMAVTRTLLRDLAGEGLPLSEILSQANRRLLNDNRNSMFVTLFLGRFDPASGRLRYANAGHPPPLLIRAGACVAERFGEPTGTVLGALADQSFEEREGRLGSGDLLVVYTDGVPEARAPGREFYGEERMVSMLTDGPEPDVRGLCERLAADVSRFQEGVLADDVTLLALRRRGLPEGAQRTG
jgi:sigma-B regulation protein RsbU (phosphoserine phosphatase)